MIFVFGVTEGLVNEPVVCQHQCNIMALPQCNLLSDEGLCFFCTALPDEVVLF